MKKNALTVQICSFLFCMLFFVIPSIVTAFSNFDGSTFQNWTFPWYQILTGTAFLLFFIFYNHENSEYPVFHKNFYIKCLDIIFLLSLLFFTSLIFKFLAVLIPSGTKEVKIIKPQNFVQFLFCLLNFFFSAAYEEILYRSILPDFAIKILRQEEKPLNWIIILIEITVCLLFALAHFYAGWLSVLNAICGHLILRFFFKKTKNLYVNISAHFLYNILILFVF